MFYEFPKNITLDEMRQAIAGREEFVEKDCGSYVIFNYNYNMPDTFPPIYDTSRNTLASLRREARGIAFDKQTGLCIRRPPHKFFNLGERPETRNLDQSDKLGKRVGGGFWDNPYVILEKLDGSCVTPFFDIVNNKLIWGTPMGDTHITTMVEEFVKDKPLYKAFVETLYLHGYCPTFEFCSRKNRVVIDHPEDRLVLTCVRNIDSGLYLDYIMLKGLADLWELECVKEVSLEQKSRQDFSNVDRLENSEGIIIRFDNGHMLKVKTEWYCNLHGVVTGIRYEKDVFQMIMLNLIDDALPFIPDDLRNRIFNYEIEIYDGILEVAEYAAGVVKQGAGMSIPEFVKFAYSKNIKGELVNGRQDELAGFMINAFKICNHGNDDYSVIKCYIFEEIRNFLSKPERMVSQAWIDRLRFLYNNRRFII